MNYQAARINRERVAKLQEQEEDAARAKEREPWVQIDHRNLIIADHHRRHFDALVARHRWLGANAEDAVQEAYVKAIQYWDNCEPKTPAGFMTWFWIIMQNSAKDMYADGQGHGTEGEKPIQVSVPASQEDRMIAADMMAAINKHSEPTRSVLKASLIDQYTAYEIADFLPVSVSNVWKITQRFREEVA